MIAFLLFRKYFLNEKRSRSKLMINIMIGVGGKIHLILLVCVSSMPYYKTFIIIIIVISHNVEYVLCHLHVFVVIRFQVLLQRLHSAQSEESAPFSVCYALRGVGKQILPNTLKKAFCVITFFAVQCVTMYVLYVHNKRLEQFVHY